MTKSFRRTLFYLSVAVFIIVSALVLFFALGYSYDPNRNKIIKTGSLSVKTNVSAQVVIDDDVKGTTSLLGRTFTEKALIPGYYHLQVQKDGFWPWQKIAEVKEGLVTDFSQVALMPRALPEETVWEKGGSMFFISSDRNLLAAIGNQKISFYDVPSRIVIYETETEKISVTGVKVIWNTDSRSLILTGHRPVPEVFYPFEKKILSLAFLPAQFVQEQYDAVFSGDYLYALKNHSWQRFNLSNRVREIMAENTASFRVNPESLLFIDNRTYQLHDWNLANQEDDVLSDFVFPNPSSFDYFNKIEEASYLVVGGCLYRLENSKITLLAEKVNKIAVSPDNFFLAWSTNHELWVLAVKQHLYQPLKNKGEKELITRLSESISDFSWYRDSGHLLLNLSSGLIIVESDTRGGVNSHPLMELSSDETAWYDADLNQIFRLNQGRLSTVNLEVD